MTQLTDKHFSVEVPSMAFGFMVNNYGHESELVYMLPMSDDENTKEIVIVKPLPPGTWRFFLFTTKSATEEQARTVVEHDAFIDGYKDYDTDRFHHDTPFIKATDSLISLLQSKGLDPDKNNYALIIELTTNGK